MPILPHDGTADKAGIFDALSAMERSMQSSAGHDLAVVIFSGHGTMIDNRFYPVPAQHVGVLTVGTGLDLDRSFPLTRVERGTGDKLDLIIHWQGGDHTRLEVKKNKIGQNRWATDADVTDLVRVLARQMPDQAIA